MANYPASLDTFVQHADNVRETIAAAHANTLQDSVVAIEQTLGTAPQGASTTVKDRLNALEAAVSAAVTNQGYAPPVASTTVRGIVKLSGDLSGTADAPLLTALPNLATIAYADSPRRVKDLGSVSGTVNLDLTLGSYFTCIATGNLTFTVTGWNTKTLYQDITVKVIQDTTGGRTVTWPTRFSTNSTTSGLATTAGSYVLWRFASHDIGASVSLWAQPAFSVPVQADRFDAAVLNLTSLLYYWPTEELSGTTATDASAAASNGTYSGTFTFNSVNTVPTSSKWSPTFTSANSNYIQRDATRRAAGTAAWSLGFTIKAADPGLAAQEVIYAETLSTDNTTGQGFYIESGTTALSGGKTAVNMRLTNNAGANVFNKVLGSVFFDNLAHFVVVSFDGGSIYSIYFDGVLTDTVVQTPTAPTVDRATYGARRRLSNDRFFSGALGRMWLRTTITSAAEIAALYSAWTTGSAAGGSGQGGGTGTQGGGGGQGTGTGVFDRNGVDLHVPTATVNNSSVTLSAVVDRSQTVNFTYLQIAVRPPAGSGGTAFSTAFTPGTQTGSGTQTLSGSGTCDAAGTWSAFATYSLAANPVQADWVDGTPVTFQISAVAPPAPTGGGTGGGGGTVLLGCGGVGNTNGVMDSWIGRPIDIAGTWSDGNSDGQVNAYTIQPGADYGTWNRYLDLAVGGIFPHEGESWTQGANGAYDGRFTQCLTNIKNYWGTRDPSKLFIRFAHEFSGDWFWGVHGSETAQFIATWKRFRALQKQIMPLAKLVWCPADQASGSLGLQVLDAFPGPSYVDIYAIDTYDSYPWSAYTNQSDFDAYMNKGLGTRNPGGAEAHRAAAQAYGLPFGIGEWGIPGDPNGGGGGGDAPGYYNKFFDWIFAHQGTGPGQVMYAVEFNIGQWQVNPNFQQPNAAAAFRTRMLNRV